jgi:hypothetical protein
MIRNDLFENTLGLNSLHENTDRISRCGVAEHAPSDDEPRGIIPKEDDLLILFFKPIRMPEAITESPFISNIRALSLFMGFVFCQSFLFEDLMDPIVSDVDVLFCKDLLTAAMGWLWYVSSTIRFPSREIGDGFLQDLFGYGY